MMACQQKMGSKLGGLASTEGKRWSELRLWVDISDRVDPRQFGGVFWSKGAGKQR
jgi:hypothetical protein